MGLISTLRKAGIGKNLFDKSKAVSGEYISNIGFFVNAEFMRSDYIGIEPTKNYKLSGTTAAISAGRTSIGYFDSNKTFISYQLYYNDGSTTLVIPPTTAYIIFSLVTADLGTAQFELGSKITVYESYGLGGSGCLSANSSLRKR